MKKIILVLMLLLFSGAARADYNQVWPFSRGGTGQTTQQLAIDALAAVTTSGYYLRGNGSHVVMSAIQAGDVPTLNQNTSGTAASLSGALSANQLLGSLTAVAPTGQTVPSCSTSGSALLWTSGAGFSCNTSITASAAGNLLAETKTTGTSKSIKTEYLTVAGSATQTLFDYSGSGYVSSIFMAALYSNSASVNTGTINIYIDGSGSPSISMPAESFFQSRYMDGAASPNAYFNNRFFGGNCNGATNTDCSFYTKLPIPFSTEVKVTFTNGSASSITFWSVATIQAGVSNTWPRTRKLYAVESLIDAPASNATETLVNIAPGVKGSVVGVWMLDDEFPHTMNPVGASWEGNFRFYADNFTKTWIASTAYAVNDTIIDANGNLQTVTSVSSDAKSNTVVPTWSQVGGATTSDNHVTWTQTPGTPNQAWRASRPFALNMAIIDTNGYVQRVTTAGTTGAVVPSWNATPGGTTADNTVTWTNQGSTYASTIYQSSGSEDLFMMGFYGQGLPAMSSSNGLIGTTYCSTSPLSPTSVTRSMYRFFINDPITFESSLAITWQAGDTSQVTWTSGSPKVWIVVYYYTE